MGPGTAGNVTTQAHSAYTCTDPDFAKPRTWLPSVETRSDCFIQGCATARYEQNDRLLKKLLTVSREVEKVFS